MGLMDQRQKKAIINAYNFRIKANGINADKKILENNLLSLNSDEINNLFCDMLKGSKKNIIDSLNNLKIPTMEVAEKTINPASNLQDITRFKKDDSDYFKFKDDKDGMTIVKSTDGKPKTLFKSILNNANNLIEFFKTLPKKQGKIVKLTKSSDIDETKHSKTQMTIVKEIENKFPNNDVIAAMDENIYIVKGDKDLVLAETKENGKRKIKQIAEKKYNKTEEYENTSKSNNTQSNSLGGRQYVLSTNPARHSSEEQVA